MSHGLGLYVRNVSRELVVHDRPLHVPVLLVVHLLEGDGVELGTDLVLRALVQ